MRASYQRGVTLIELMTAAIVLAVLLGIGVPAFTNIIRANQIATQSNNLVAALTLARSEALKRGVRVSVCGAAAAANTCETTNNWSRGWILFEDDFGSAGVIDASDEILQVWPAPTNGVTFVPSAPAVTFARTGRAEFARSFTVTKTGCSGDQQRSISVDLSGRVGLTRTSCPTS